MRFDHVIYLYSRKKPGANARLADQPARALTIEKYGLEFTYSRPLFDAQSLWRIPAGINVAPIPLPVRKIIISDVVVLNARRAGNRGQANRRKTTPVSA
jgi:hypothetical protein